MRIGVDARSLCGNKTGIGNYLEQILKCLEKIDENNEYYLFAHQDFELNLNGKFKKKIYRGRPGSLWLQYMVPCLLIKYKIDLFWGPNYAIPLFTPKKVKTVITIHDMVSFVYPETLPAKTVLHNQKGLPLYVKRVNRIITESESTKCDIIKYLNIPDDKIDITLLGVNPKYFLKSKNPVEVLENYNINFPYILCVGTIEPRKNLINVIRAFSNLTEDPLFRHHLVIVGANGWKYSELYNLIEENKKLNDKIHFLGYIPNDHLPVIYQASSAFVYPSYYEGFGLPPLEAMASGVPVITSNTSSMPEVVGEAGVLVNPYSSEEITQSIKKILYDEDFTKQLSKLSLLRAKQFGWQNTAQQTLKIFEKVINEG